MLKLLGSPRRLCDGVSRREMLRQTDKPNDVVLPLAVTPAK